VQQETWLGRSVLGAATSSTTLGTSSLKRLSISFLSSQQQQEMAEWTFSANIPSKLLNGGHCVALIISIGRNGWIRSRCAEL
jgi:hypothetical protein